MIFNLVWCEWTDHSKGRMAQIYQGDTVVWEGYSCDEVADILRAVGILFTQETENM